MLRDDRGYDTAHGEVFKSAEAEIVSLASLQHGPWKINGGRFSVGGEAVDLRAAGIGQSPVQVWPLCQNILPPHRRWWNPARVSFRPDSTDGPASWMPATDNQRDVRLEGREISNRGDRRLSRVRTNALA